MRLRPFLITIVLALVLPATAEAGKVPIPCTGERLVKVLDIPWPATGGMPKIDLGYKFTGCWGGEWVGYTGGSGKYLQLSTEQMTILLLMAGRKELPSPPFRLFHPGAMWVEWLWALIVLFALASTDWKSRGSPVDPQTALVSDVPDQEKARADAINAEIARRVAAQAQPSLRAPAPKPAGRATVQRPSIRTSFGQRSRA